MRAFQRRINCLGMTAMFLVAVSAFGHVRVSPAESAAGAAQRYTMRVPTERQSATVRIELAIPPSVSVSSFGTTGVWKVEPQKDAQGKITGAVWSGGSIPFAEYAEFSFEAMNPTTPTKVEWKVIQIYQDGTRSEWTGAEGSRTPSSVTTIR